jgi:hypothetical protein
VSIEHYLLPPPLPALVAVLLVLGLRRLAAAALALASRHGAGDPRPLDEALAFVAVAGALANARPGGWPAGRFPR